MIRLIVFIIILFSVKISETKNNAELSEQNWKNPEEVSRKVSRNWKEAAVYVKDATSLVDTIIKAFNQLDKVSDLASKISLLLGPAGAVIGMALRLITFFVGEFGPPPGPSEELLAIRRLEEKLDTMQMVMISYFDKLEQLIKEKNMAVERFLYDREMFQPVRQFSNVYNTKYNADDPQQFRKWSENVKEACKELRYQTLLKNMHDYAITTPYGRGLFAITYEACLGEDSQLFTNLLQYTTTQVLNAVFYVSICNNATDGQNLGMHETEKYSQAIFDAIDFYLSKIKNDSIDALHDGSMLNRIISKWRISDQKIRHHHSKDDFKNHHFATFAYNELNKRFHQFWYFVNVFEIVGNEISYYDSWQTKRIIREPKISFYFNNDAYNATYLDGNTFIYIAFFAPFYTCSCTSRTPLIPNGESPLSSEHDPYVEIEVSHYRLKSHKWPSPYAAIWSDYENRTDFIHTDSSFLWKEYKQYHYHAASYRFNGFPCVSYHNSTQLYVPTCSEEDKWLERFSVAKNAFKLLKQKIDINWEKYPYEYLAAVVASNTTNVEDVTTTNIVSLRLVKRAVEESKEPTITNVGFTFCVNNHVISFVIILYYLFILSNGN